MTKEEQRLALIGIHAGKAGAALRKVINSIHVTKLKELMIKIMGDKEPCKPKPHKGQKKITINGHSFYADIELIPLIKELNKLGLFTYSHCYNHGENNHPNYPWIVLDMENINSVEVRKGKTGRPQLLIGWIR